MVSASASPCSGRSPTQATYPSGRINTAAGALTAPIAGSSHVPTYLASISLTRSAHGVISKAAWLTEVEDHWPCIVQKGEDSQRAAGGDQVEIGHTSSQQRVSLAEVIVNVQAGLHRGEPSPRLVHAEELGNYFAQCLRAFVLAPKSDRGHRVAQHAGGDRVALGMVAMSGFVIAFNRLLWRPLYVFAQRRLTFA